MRDSRGFARAAREVDLQAGEVRFDPGRTKNLQPPHPQHYAGRRIFVARRHADVLLVPFVEDEHPVFSRTIILR